MWGGKYWQLYSELRGIILLPLMTDILAPLLVLFDLGGEEGAATLGAA
jgi:hypothetical protein